MLQSQVPYMVFEVVDRPLFRGIALQSVWTRPRLVRDPVLASARFSCGCEDVSSASMRLGSKLICCVAALTRPRCQPRVELVSRRMLTHARLDPTKS